MRIAFIGPGVTGFPMAGHLQAAGCEVCVYNRTASRAQQWAERHGGRCAATPAQAGRRAGGQAGADTCFAAFPE
jgi:3-hydroxyisobutyrate dehydrogenase-like beta-hydroxyacid dehydrogenase